VTVRQKTWSMLRNYAMLKLYWKRWFFQTSPINLHCYWFAVLGQFSLLGIGLWVTLNLPDSGFSCCCIVF
jgi:hypothetical protein